ncbi:RNA polymerase sigma factor [Sphingomonas parva]|uniref:RNA polymerase sigma factor n=1 Tax=Sphingomonas parva TaxID=2555898 RepID=A0A4Y8ZNV7_9SPHN|nr:RNA polymerase sigma factor [Sphingomonas parva]TFI57698.1 RNA polymerase sigma factor [Sphingomonas parva]
MEAGLRRDEAPVDDVALAARVARGDAAAVRVVTQRHNQRLFRTAFAILGNRSEAEDAVQSAYLSAFRAIGRFEGRASLATWLTRIVVNESLGRARAAKRRRERLDPRSVVVLDDYRERLMAGSTSAAPPDAALARAQIRQMLEQAIARLPEAFRLVFVLREVEGLSIEEVAAAVGIPEGTVKTRHLRAKRRLQEALAPELKTALSGTFPFLGPSCEAMTRRVTAALCGGEVPETR